MSTQLIPEVTSPCGYCLIVCAKTMTMMNIFAKIVLYSYDLHVKTLDVKTVKSITTISAHVILSQGSQFSVCHKLLIKEDL